MPYEICLTGVRNLPNDSGGREEEEEVFLTFRGGVLWYQHFVFRLYHFNAAKLLAEYFAIVIALLFVEKNEVSFLR